MGKKFKGKMRNRNQSWRSSYIQPEGAVEIINAQSVRVHQRDENGDITHASGTETISDNAEGYAKGCLYRDTDVAAGTTGVYENVGTALACNFDVIGSGGGGATTFVGLTDTPANFTAAGDKIVKVNTGATALEFVAVSGDAAMSAAGVFTVTDLTIASEAQGAVLYHDGSGWEALTAGTDGYILKAQGAAADPVWIDPATLPLGTATGLSQSFTIEGGTNDITVGNTTQTVGAVALTIPDFASVADSFAFITLAQVFKNKNLDDASCFWSDTADATKKVVWEISGATTAKTLTLDTNHTDDRTILFPDATTTLIGLATTDVLLNKTLDDATCKFGDTADATKDLFFSLGGATTAKTMTLISSHTDDRSLTLPDATDTLIGKATADTLTNKTLDCDGAGNAVSNVNMDEMDPITIPSAGDASDSVYGVPGILMVDVSNQSGAVNIYSSNAPFKFIVTDAWSQNLSADGGTWKLDNGANDLCSAVTVGASDDDIDRVADMDDAYNTIAASGSLRLVVDGGGALDAYVYINILRLA